MATSSTNALNSKPMHKRKATKGAAVLVHTLPIMAGSNREFAELNGSATGATESTANDSEVPGGVAAVDRALLLLTCFRNGDAGLSLTELAARTGLYKSTTLRLLTSLQHARIIQKQTDGSYRLGGEIARLNAVFAQSLDLEPVIVPALRQLVRLTNESAAFHVARGEGEQRMRLCLYRVECTQTIRVHVRQGEWMPVDRGTGARVLNAYASNAMPEDRLLAKVRKQGYYAASGDRKDEVGGISAPIFNATGNCIGVMTLTMPRHRYDEKWLDHVLAIASDASQSLGYSK